MQSPKDDIIEVDQVRVHSKLITVSLTIVILLVIINQLSK